MQTSLIETRDIEEYLLGRKSPEESVLFQANLILRPELSDKLKWQERTFVLVQLYGRKKLKAELQEVEGLLFREVAFEGFRNKILRLFNL